MSLLLSPVRSDLLFAADFTEPAFDLIKDWSGLARQIVTRLGRLGLKLSDMKVESGVANLADIHLECALFNSTTTVRIRPERIEINCFDLARVKQTQLEELAIETLEAARACLPDTRFRTYTSVIGVHGTIAEMTPYDFVSRFAKNAPADLGPSLGSGTVFYYGADAERVMSSVTVDLSAVVANGLFLRVYVVWDATKVAIDKLSELASKQFERVLGELGLILKRE